MGISSCLSPTFDGSVIVDVEVQPSAKTQGIIGFNDWRARISVAVKAEARDGKANQAVVHVLATQLQLDVRSLRITSGHTSRLKSVRVENAHPEELVRQFEFVLEGLR